MFFTIVNPYTDGIQGKCTGPHYRTGIYYVSGEDTPQITYYMAYYQNRGNSRPVSESCLVFNEYENEKIYGRRSAQKPDAWKTSMPHRKKNNIFSGNIQIPILLSISNFRRGGNTGNPHLKRYELVCSDHALGTIILSLTEAL